AIVFAALDDDDDVVVVAKLAEVLLPALLIILVGADEVVARGVVFQASGGDGGGCGAKQEGNDENQTGVIADPRNESAEKATNHRRLLQCGILVGHPVIP